MPGSRKVRVGEVGHGRAHPDHQRQRHGGHQPEHAAPVHQAAEPGAGGHADAQGQRLARAHHRQGPALLARGHHAARIAGQQAPQQAGRHTAGKARRQRQRVMGRQRRDHVENAQAGNRQQQQRPAVPAASGGDEGDRREHRAGREQGDQLPGQRLGDAQALADLRQQAGGHGLGHDGDETRQRQGQQLAQRQTVGVVLGAGAGGQGWGETHAETPIAVKLEWSFQKRTKQGARHRNAAVCLRCPGDCARRLGAARSRGGGDAPAVRTALRSCPAPPRSRRRATGGARGHCCPWRPPAGPGWW